MTHRCIYKLLGKSRNKMARGWVGYETSETKETSETVETVET